FYIYDTYGYGGVMGVGGTSAGAPQWAALVAIAGEMAGPNLDGASQTLPPLYNTARTASSSNFPDNTPRNAGRHRAGRGFDLLTGWGSPIADSVVPAFASAPTASDSMTSPRPITPPPTHGDLHDVTVIQVPPVASPLPPQTVTIGAVSERTANP